MVHMMHALVKTMVWVILPNPNMNMPEVLRPYQCFLLLGEVLCLSMGLQYAPCLGQSFDAGSTDCLAAC